MTELLLTSLRTNKQKKGGRKVNGKGSYSTLQQFSFVLTVLLLLLQTLTVNGGLLAYFNYKCWKMLSGTWEKMTLKD